MPIPSEARTYSADVSLLSRQSAATVLGLWRQIDAGDISRSWLNLLPLALAAVAAAQVVAAEMADPYTAAVTGIAEQAPIRPDAYAGTASDGRDLASLLYLPAIEAKQRIETGMRPTSALRSIMPTLAMYTRTTVTDAARQSAAAAVGARRSLGGYRRMLNLPSCSRCTILAGKWFRWNQGFDRHPRCFPAGVAVSGPSTLAASRRWYEGELVVLTTASGQQLPLTGNHPVLTRRGWLPAHLLQEGDEVVRSTRAKGATPLVVPDHQQMPALIENVWGSLGVAGLHRVPSTAEDFHGDGSDGEVDVVYANSPLGDVRDASFVEQRGEHPLAVGGKLALAFHDECMPVLVDLGRSAHAGGPVGSKGLPLPLVGRHFGGADLAGVAPAAAWDAMRGESPLDDVAADAILATEGIFAGTSPVGGGDPLDRELLLAPRWDAPAAKFSVETRMAYASRGQDLHHRLAGQVELDRIVELRRLDWAGHVYSLTSAEGWHEANGLIVSNCDCVHIPAAEAADVPALNPRTAIESGRVTGLSRAEREAIDLGADPAQIVNARRGMRTLAGRRFTTEGTTRRGVAGARILQRDVERALGGIEAVAGRTFTNLTFSRQRALEYQELFSRGKRFTRLTSTGRAQSYTYGFTGTHRPAVDTILRDAATDRAEAIRLLTNFGYIL